MDPATLPGRKFCAMNLKKLGVPNITITKATGLSLSTIRNLSKNKPSSFNRKQRKSSITEEMGRFLKIFFSRFSSYMGGSLRKATNRLNEEFGSSG